jgi:hypothetical protein
MDKALLTVRGVTAATFGFVDAAERLNARVCMMAFVLLIVIELIAGRGIFDITGFTVGQGLGFEF